MTQEQAKIKIQIQTIMEVSKTVSLSKSHREALHEVMMQLAERFKDIRERKED